MSNALRDNKASLSLLEALRARGKQNFSALPTQRVEAWKYTPLKALEAFNLSDDNNQAALLDSNIVPLFNKQALSASKAEMAYVDLESLPKEITFLSLSDAAQHQPHLLQKALGQAADPTHPFAALNDLQLHDGVFLHVPANVILKEPLELFFLSDGSAQKTVSHPRIVIVLERGASATIIEHHKGSGAYVRNSVSEIILEQGARLQHYRLQNDSLDAAHMALTGVQCARDAHYDYFTLTQGAALGRQEIHADLLGENAEVNLNGAMILKGRQHGDTTSEIRHIAPHCRSRQTVKTVLNDSAHGVFQGKVHVHQQAQKTDGYQMNQALLLSDRAEMDSKPELEIFADDVKCSHGATVGQLDEQALFYLRSRGIPVDIARDLLIQSFIGGAIDLIENGMVREVFQHLAASFPLEGEGSRRADEGAIR